MSNSKLVIFARAKKTNNRNSPRNHSIDTITIHHMAGNLSLANCFNSVESRGGSCNYAIDSNGNIGLMVDERDRSWCSSNPPNDHRAVTIEVANSCNASDGDKLGWPVSDKAMAALINLCVDICKRNGIKKLNYTGDTSGNLTMHKWFAPTGCPGPYLSSKFPYIAEQVNKRLRSSKTTQNTKKTSVKTFKPYKVKITYEPGMNVRSDAGVSCKLVNGVTAKYNVIYTIVAERIVDGQVWGKLKSGAGWICLTGFTKKV